MGSCLGNPTDGGDWRGYSPRGHKESQTERLSPHTHTHTHTRVLTRKTSKVTQAAAKDMLHTKALPLMQTLSRRVLPVTASPPSIRCLLCVWHWAPPFLHIISFKSPKTKGMGAGILLVLRWTSRHRAGAGASLSSRTRSHHAPLTSSSSMLPSPDITRQGSLDH